MCGNTSAGRTASPWFLLFGCLFLSSFFPLSSAKAIQVLTTTYDGGWIQDGVMFDVKIVGKNDGDSVVDAPDGITIFGLNILTPLTETFCVEVYTMPSSHSSASSDPSAWTFLGSFRLTGQGPNSHTSIPIGAFDPITIGVDRVQAFYVTTQNEKLRYTALSDGTQTGDVYVSSDGNVRRGAHAAIERAGREGEGRGNGHGDDDGGGENGIGGRNRDRNEVRNYNRHGNDNAHGKGDGGESRRALQEAPGKSSSSAAVGERRLQHGGLEVQILVGVAKNYPFAESWPHRVFNGALLYALGRDHSLDFLSEAQRKDARDAKRGLATCDANAIPIESYASAMPSDPKLRAMGPIESPTKTPGESPGVSPTVEPTTLESTTRKVATTLHGGLKQSGCMFDIYVPSVEDGGPETGLTVITLEMSTPILEEICVEVYTKEGTYEGFEDDVVQTDDGSWSSPTWSILGAATMEGRGETEPTQLPIGSLDPVHVPPGTRRGFYVTMTVPEMRYTEPKYGEVSGTLFSGSPFGHLELMVGSAVSYPFDEVWRDRIFNGAVVYALGDVPDGRYNGMTADMRDRACPIPTESPTKSPRRGPSATPINGPTMSPNQSLTADQNNGPMLELVAPSPNAGTVDTGDDSETAGDDESDGDDETDLVDETDGVEGEKLANSPSSTMPTPTTAATIAVIKVDGGPGDLGDANSVASPPPTPLSSPLHTVSPTFGAASHQDDPAVSGAKLVGNCPSAADDYSRGSREVVVPYEYSVLSGGGADLKSIANEMESVVHHRLMADKCEGPAGRALQEVPYLGFDSSPPDQVLDKGCGDGAGVDDGQECHLVAGGLTAVVMSDADTESVHEDIGLYVGGVLSDPTSFEGLPGEVYIETGITDGGALGSASNGSTGDRGNAAEGEGSDAQDLNLDGARGGNQDPPPNASGDAPKGLSTTSIIIVTVLAGFLALVILVLVVMRLRKKSRTKHAASKKLFREFPEEADRVRDSDEEYEPKYGITASSSGGYDESFAPLSSTPSPTQHLPSGLTPPRPASRVSSRSASSGRSVNASAHPAIIVNEQDDISLFSNDRSRRRFTSTSKVPPDSPGVSQGSRGSQGSGASKRSVEFIRAGQSFSSIRGGRVEDTVDL